MVLKFTFLKKVELISLKVTVCSVCDMPEIPCVLHVQHCLIWLLAYFVPWPEGFLLTLSRFLLASCLYDTVLLHKLAWHR